MKSKDQQLLEEAYLKIQEGRYTDNYGRLKFKSKGSPLGDFDDSARRELQNDERNAGLEDEEDVEDSPAIPAPANLKVSTPPAPPSVEIDTSLLAGKKIDSTLWDYPDYVITIDGKPIGMMVDKSEQEQLVSLLSDIENNKNNPLVQKWYRTAVEEL